MILIIAEPRDHAAHWLAQQLRGRVPSAIGAGAIRLISPAQLIYSTSIVHRLSTADGASSFRLTDGSLVDFSHVTGVVNRMVAMPTRHLDAASPADRDYAATELHAFLLGWLASLECPVLNRPAPEWLAGAHRSPMAALHLAAAAGLEVAPQRFETPDDAPVNTNGLAATTHFVCKHQVIGPIIERAGREALLTLAESWGAALVQIDTSHGPGGRRFLRATSFPDYPRGGTALVRAVAKALGA